MGSSKEARMPIPRGSKLVIELNLPILYYNSTVWSLSMSLL